MSSKYCGVSLSCRGERGGRRREGKRGKERGGTEGKREREEGGGGREREGKKERGRDSGREKDRTEKGGKMEGKDGPEEEWRSQEKKDKWKGERHKCVHTHLHTQCTHAI